MSSSQATPQPVVAAKRARAAALLAGARLSLYPIALTLLSTFPGRRAIGAREAQYGNPAWHFVLGGLGGDLAGVLPLLAGLLGGFWTLAWALRTWRGRAAHPGRLERSGSVLLAAALFAASWLLCTGASEHKLQRGLYPTLLEIASGLGDPVFVRGSLPLVWGQRYLAWTIVGTIAAIALGLGRLRAIRRGRIPPLGWLGLCGFALGTAAAMGLGGVVLLRADRIFPSIDHRRVLYPPLVTVAKGLRAQKTAIFRGLRSVLIAAQLPDPQVMVGARALGFADAHARRLLAPDPGPGCASHPLARPLPGDVPRPPATGSAIGGPGTLAGETLALSRAIFEGVEGPVVVWQIAIESLRADDLHALHPAALAEVTPFLNDLYQRSAPDRAPEPGAVVVALPHVFQAGTRTAQALGALQCGLGAMPFNLSISRDLGYLPLRCLPDVLKDAGLHTRAFYGSHLSYDNMLEFFRYHGVQPTQNVDFPKGLPTGVWGCLADRGVYDFALSEAERRGGSQYNFILTLASHTPFDRPEDLPAEVVERVDRGLARRAAAAGSAGGALGQDDRRRLHVFAYADWALAQFFRRLESSPLAARSVVVVSADHATADDFLWSRGPTEEGLSRIPLILYVPAALAARGGDPARLGPLAARLSALAATTPISENDVPTLVLALLAASEPLRGLDPAWRWHTLGGMSSSADYLHPSRPGAPLWGIDSRTALFWIEPGALSPGELTEPSPAFNDPSQLPRLGPTIVPAAALLSSLLRGYASACPDASSIRRAP